VAIAHSVDYRDQRSFVLCIEALDGHVRTREGDVLSCKFLPQHLLELFERGFEVRPGTEHEPSRARHCCLMPGIRDEGPAIDHTVTLWGQFSVDPFRPGWLSS
jgi:hypothetical protein